MKRKPPVLTAKDLANIRAIIQAECLQVNKETRRELQRLRKENAEIRKPKLMTMPPVIKFLLGEGALDGVNYGERPGNLPPYWWRSELRKLFQDSTDNKSDDKDKKA